MAQLSQLVAKERLREVVLSCVEDEADYLALLEDEVEGLTSLITDNVYEMLTELDTSELVDEEGGQELAEGEA